jgi:hypothetical protein
VPNPLLRLLATTLATTLVGAAMVAPVSSSSAASATASTAATVSAAATTATAARTERRAPARRIAYTEWAGATGFAAGTAEGVRVVRGRLRLAEPVAQRTYAQKRYDEGRWSSPWTSPGFGLTELIASWSAITPGDSWIEVKVRGRDAGGKTSSWDVLGRWTSGDTYTRRTSVAGQGDDLADVNVDTWQTAQAAGLVSWQLQVSLLRKAGTTTSPRVTTVGAVASRLPDVSSVTTSAPGVARGIVLDVPRYSQMMHRGHYPAWGNGGQAWCSPTSTSMVLGYYDALPTASSYSWVPGGHVDPWVDAAARSTYDASYRGTGNWSFNAAYAAPLAGHAFVTRLRSLREAERYIAAGIPLVASVSFARGELANAPISSTNGHLLVVVGFTKTGDVIVNDPAATQRSAVRRTYDRGQFENVWIPRSGGLVYVIRDAAHPLP